MIFRKHYFNIAVSDAVIALWTPTGPISQASQPPES